MRLHYAGSDANEKYNDILRSCGAKNRLESYWSLKKKAPSQGFTLLLDSGGFVARLKGTKIDVSEFAKFVNEHKVTMAFNLDTNDLEETLENQKHLEQNTSAYILPVYHYQDYESGDRSLLQEWIKLYPYIGIGGVVGAKATEEQMDGFFRYVFKHTQDKTKLHGLGITTQKWLEAYPWFSVDSTSWLGAARFGNSKSESDKILSSFNAKNVHYLTVTLQEAKWWARLEQYITELWDKRGVKWDTKIERWN